MSIQETTEQIVKEFSIFNEWMDRYNYLIELGRNCPTIEEKDKQEKFLIEGCQSRVWLVPHYENGIITFKADSDAVITKGIASLLIRALSGHTPQEIIDADLSFIDKIGLREHLSPTRSNGLTSMLKQIKLYAIAYNMAAR